MKKLLCLLLAMCLLAGCAAKDLSRNAVSSAEPVPEPVSSAEPVPEPVSSAEPVPEPVSSAEPVPEATEEPASEPAPEPEPPLEGPPPDDSWEPGPEPSPEPQYEPVELLSKMSTQQRKELNIFMSNFSELNFPNFKRDDYDLATVVNFAYMHNKINSFGRDKIDVRQWNGESCYSISTADVDACLDRFLGVQVEHEGFEMDMHQIGCDGERYYFPAADGEAFNTFTVVNFMNRMADGKTIAVSFDIYDLDYEVYWDTGLEDKYYAMTPEEAESCGVLTRRGEGTADLEEYVYHGVSTYRLLYYWAIP